MNLKFATVEGQKVFVGDYVGFKSDIEQSGKIIKIKRNIMDQVVLVLENEYGFDGDYLQGCTTTEQLPCDCWIL